MLERSTLCKKCPKGWFLQIGSHIQFSLLFYLASYIVLLHVTSRLLYLQLLLSILCLLHLVNQYIRFILSNRTINTPYSQKILWAPIFKDFKVFCLTSNILSLNFCQKSRTDLAIQFTIQQLAMWYLYAHIHAIASVECLQPQPIANKRPAVTLVATCRVQSLRLAATVDCNSRY